VTGTIVTRKLDGEKPVPGWSLFDEHARSPDGDRYRAMATSLGFEGHMKWAEAMP
jgi:hypothetical protein